MNMSHGFIVQDDCTAEVDLCTITPGRWARVVIETVKEWASRNIKKVEWIVLVDIYGKFIPR